MRNNLRNRFSFICLLCVVFGNALRLDSFSFCIIFFVRTEKIDIFIFISSG
jgi:hypothetical protein